ncbi:rhamnogalacturonan acetylesterase [Roridomyces roridus]|uniref:Rhamnogalacturonan acetylesterase n=1 Tax=Roridomyces roridus TaxID=1738132 RepID=A0AAD7BUK6_9AGAR|nr:rhamnogalacturonan acetylesterase [Roridomyces roridus]
MLTRVAVSLFISLGAYAQTVFMAGDSTMAPGGGGSGTDGWGQYLGQFLTIPVVNDAIAGRSARSYTDEGRFTTLTSSVKSGDFVIIEFGHNDGLSGTTDNGRQDSFGDSLTATTTVTLANGTSAVIHTFNFYMQQAVTGLKAKGANVIVSSQTPDDIWTGTSIGAPPRFVQYAKEVAGNNTGVAYVDHYAYVAQAYDKLGESAVDPFYPIDHTHTLPAGATVVAEAFVRGLLCGGSALSAKVNAAGKAVPNGCV